MFVTHKIPPRLVKVIRIGMDHTGEFNYPCASPTTSLLSVTLASLTPHWPVLVADGQLQGGGKTNNTWWAFDEGGKPFSDWPASLGSWRPGTPNTAGGNESSVFIAYYYEKLAAFQDYMVRISLEHFPEAMPAILYPGSSPDVNPADVEAAAAALGEGRMRDVDIDPIAAGWARYLLVPSMARTSKSALAWHTGCEQEQGSSPLTLQPSLPF